MAGNLRDKYAKYKQTYKSRQEAAKQRAEDAESGKTMSVFFQQKTLRRTLPVNLRSGG